MYIPILIPIGVKRVAAVQGAVWKFVSCAQCQQRYAYLVELEATGEDHDLLFLDGKGSAERARAQAEQNLVQQSRNVVLPVPCPSCGFYQDDMARKLKDEASINSLQIAGVVIVLLSLVPLALGIPYIWVLTIVLGVTGLAVLAWGYAVRVPLRPERGRSRAEEGTWPRACCVG